MTKRRKVQKTTTARARAFALAQQLAADAVRGFFLEEHAGSFELYGNHIGAVQEVLEGNDTPPDETLHEAVKRIADPKVQLEADHAIGNLMNLSMDSGYFYGLAMGMALAKGWQS